MKKHIKLMLNCLAAVMALSGGLQTVSADDAIAIETTAVEAEAPALSVQGSFSAPAFTEPYPSAGFSSVSSSFLSAASDTIEYEKYLIPVNKSVTQNGITVTINAMGYDGKTLMVVYETFFDEGVLGEKADAKETPQIFMNPMFAYTDLVDEKYKALPEIQDAFNRYKNGELSKAQIHQKLLEYSWNNSADFPVFVNNSSFMQKIDENHYKGLISFENSGYPKEFSNRISRDPDKKISIYFNDARLEKTLEPNQEIDEGYSIPDYYKYDNQTANGDSPDSDHVPSYPIFVTKTIPGYWQVDTDFSENEVTLQTEKFVLSDSRYDNDGETIYIEEISKSPLGNRLIVSGTMKLEPVQEEFNGRVINRTPSPEFFVLDQNGNSIIKKRTGGSWSNDQIETSFSLKMTFDNLDDVQTLTVVPYLIKLESFDSLADRNYFDIPFDNINGTFEVDHTLLTITDFVKTEDKISFNISSKGYLSGEEIMRNIFLKNNDGSIMYSSYQSTTWDDETKTGYVEFINLENEPMFYPGGVFTNINEAVSLAVAVQNFTVLDKYIFDVEIIR